MGKPCTCRAGKRKRIPKIPYGKPRTRNLSRERVYQLVREIVLERKAKIEARLGRPDDYGQGWLLSRITAEELAAELNVDIHKVILALQQLRLRGLVGKPERTFAHDTSRNLMFGGPDSGWSANRYSILTETLPYNREPKPKESKPTWGSPEGTVLVWDHEKAKRYRTKKERKQRRMMRWRG